MVAQVIIPSLLDNQEFQELQAKLIKGSMHQYGYMTSPTSQISKASLSALASQVSQDYLSIGSSIERPENPLKGICNRLDQMNLHI